VEPRDRIRGVILNNDNFGEIHLAISLVSKLLLLPFATVYGSVVALRNYLYDEKIFKAVRFDIPVIGIGNLTAGGTGKSPHIEYLLTYLQYTYKVATLSRGYGRKTHGFVLAGSTSTASDIGDEPRQFKRKFPDAVVTVCEDRVLGLPRILHESPDVDVVLLDDAFQHRSIVAGLSLLLTDYSLRFTHDNLIPIGWLRESKRNYHRADLIIVTKCPENISEEEKKAITLEIKPFRYQRVYFSSIQYGPLYSFNDGFAKTELTKDMDVLLVCGIAKHEGLEKYLQSKVRNVYLRGYRDHHHFDVYDLEQIRETFKDIGDGKKILVTTEKDAARLEEHRDWFLQNKIEIFVQPISVKFVSGDEEKFNADIIQYIETTRQKLNL
jgi:tetraacyldisaccharide 4'-kinase